jgi:hypothetical protein
MKYRDTLELLEKHPNYFQSLQYANDRENTRPWRKTFIFAQPRTGSTLLMRLLSGACLTRCVGDKHPEYYDSVLKIYQNVRDNQGQYLDAASEAEKSGIFPDEYRGYESREREMWNVRGAISQLLFGNTFGSGYAKATCIGLGSNTEGFVTMLRELYEDDEDLRIVWLFRNQDDIVKSMLAKGALKEDGVPLFKQLLTEQRAQFKNLYQLGDVELDYDKFITEPVKTLIKLNPIYSPNPQAVEKIMAKIIR